MSHKLCDKFTGAYTCHNFIQNGGCKHPSMFMCHIYQATGKQPVEDDVPIYIGEVLETFEGSTVVKEVNPERKTKKMEDYFGKI